MRNLLFIVMLLGTWICASAQDPVIPLTQAFDGRFINDPDVTLFEIKQENNYFYRIEVKKNSKIIEQIRKWADETEKLPASTITTRINGGNYNKVISLDGSNITIGIKYPRDNSKISVFLQSIKPIL